MKKPRPEQQLLISFKNSLHSDRRAKDGLSNNESGGGLDSAAQQDDGPGELKTTELRKSPIRVAIVEDEQTIIPIYEYVIKSLGYKEELIAYDGTDVVNAILKEEAHPDLVIMDFRLPRMNGLEAAVKIRQANKRIRIILVTADSSALEKARGLGFQSVQKPFSLDELREALQHASN